MSLKDQLTAAFKAVPKKFKEGDKVKLHGEVLPYKIKKVNHLGYDLELDLTPEEIEKYKDVLNKSVGLKKIGFEHWVEYVKKDAPSTLEEIAYAENVIYSRVKYNIDEKDIEKVVD